MSHNQQSTTMATDAIASYAPIYNNYRIPPKDAHITGECGTFYLEPESVTSSSALRPETW